MNYLQTAANTHANQWCERTLDDSAVRRITIPEGFLVADIVLTTLKTTFEGLQVWPCVIAAHIDAELPFMATERILMKAVKAGGDRQVLHEAIRQHSMEAGRRVKEQGAKNDLEIRLLQDPLFQAIHVDLYDLLEPSHFIGRAPQQVQEFILEEIDPILRLHQEIRETLFDSIHV